MWPITVLMFVVLWFHFTVSSVKGANGRSKIGDFRARNVSNISDLSSSEIIIGDDGDGNGVGGIGGNKSGNFIKVTTQQMGQNNGNVDDGLIVMTTTGMSGRGGGKKVINLCETFLMNNDIDLKIGKNNWNVPIFATFADDTDEHEPQSTMTKSSPVFRLEKASPFCGMEATQTFTMAQEDDDSEQGQGGRLFLNETDSIGFLKNGYFKINHDFYNIDEYCVSSISETKIEIKYCPPECTGMRPCVQKCFPPGQVMGFLPKKAPMSSGEVEFSPKFYDDFPKNSSMSQLDRRNLRPHFIQHRPKRDFVCKTQGLHFNPFSEKVGEAINSQILSFKFHVQVDGRVFFQTLDDYNCPTLTELSRDNSCVDGIRNVGQINKFTNTENEGLIISCPFPKADIVVSLLFGVLMIASSFFLLLTFIVYVLLWHQQNVHGWTIMAHTSSLFFAYIFLGMTHIIRAKFFHLINTKFCYINGVLGHFFFLSTFSWLTLISFDLWWTFRSIVPTKKTRGTRMLMHLLIGWGFPAVIVTVSVCLDLIIGNKCTSIRLPKYGQKVCYIEENAQGLYLYYPAAVSLVCNIGFFCVTIFKLYGYKKNTRIAIKNNPSNRQLLGIFTKLFFVMGITWIFEFVSWLHVGPKWTWYWTAIDIINILQAVAIFYIYVCKPDVLESLENKYPNSLTKYILRLIRRAASPEAKSGRDSQGGGGKPSSSAGDDGEEMKTKTSTLPRT